VVFPRLLQLSQGCHERNQAEMATHDKSTHAVGRMQMAVYALRPVRRGSATSEPASAQVRTAKDTTNQPDTQQRPTTPKRDEMDRRLKERWSRPYLKGEPQGVNWANATWREGPNFLGRLRGAPRFNDPAWPDGTRPHGRLSAHRR